MKKIIKNLFFIFLLLFSLTKVLAGNSEYNRLSKGTFIPVYSVQTISTSILEENDPVYFIVASDLWIDDFQIVPKNSIIKGKVSMLKMPVTGINAAIKIDVFEIAFPNGSKYGIKGGVEYKGERQIGGNLTPPLSYNKSLHIRRGEWYNGVVSQYVPSGEYEFGQHVTLTPAEMLHVVLDEDLVIY